MVPISALSCAIALRALYKSVRHWVPLLLLTIFALGAVPGHAQVNAEGPTVRPMAPPPPPTDEGTNGASVDAQTVPSVMIVGRTYNVSVRMRNIGSKEWASQWGYALASRSPEWNMTWGVNRVSLGAAVVPYWGTFTFNFAVTAPTTPGTYTFDWGMLQDGVEWFGYRSPLTITVREPINNAEPWGQNVPAQMEQGKPYTVSVTMYNNGETTWNRAQQYTLMAQYPHNNTTWGFNRVPLPVDNIAPGQSTTFTFNVTAPNAPGSYPFQWGMQREGYGSFGPGTNVAMINVVAPPPVNNAEVVGISVPARMQTQLNYNVAVTMRNNGTTTWTPGALHRLGSQNPHDNQIWGPGRIELTSAVAPGQQYTFNFQVKAPAPGDYQMQWGMVQEGVQWFGASAASPVVVTEDLSRVTFIHTDGLGSPVARTDGAGTVLNRTRYEPYGCVAAGATPTIGFTGHVNDADTGLTYMQQRYYDPVAGRFLSVDPVVTDANTGGSFNRYAYANNSPYKYIDPDGRFPVGIFVGIGVEIGIQMGVEGKSFSELDVSNVIIAGAIGAFAPGVGSTMIRGYQAGAKVSTGLKAISKLKSKTANTANRAQKLVNKIDENAAKIAEELGEAGKTAAQAAAGVVAKKIAQDEINRQQEEAKKKEPSPPPPKE